MEDEKIWWIGVVWRNFIWRFQTNISCCQGRCSASYGSWTRLSGANYVSRYSVLRNIVFEYNVATTHKISLVGHLPRKANGTAEQDPEDVRINLRGMTHQKLYLMENPLAYYPFKSRYHEAKSNRIPSAFCGHALPLKQKVAGSTASRDLDFWMPAV